eukprot:TRINITY_DN2728_c0_g1_i1.p1 TRINITY_DN2728_c0_g1~~TRINITY_DN2728_c0_g1_i1.p1  ORF type:complete len:214 (-),score=41.24 TRINITY_DN2728_c0_g1_i1:5-646(-)
MKRKELEQSLQEVDGFEKPKVKLEQYPTSAHIASHMLFTIDSVYDEIEGRCIADLGCGCGMLAIGADMLGSSYVLGVEIDSDAIEIATQNIEDFESTSVNIIQADVLSLPKILHHPKIETVIMNPPFGTKVKGIDMAFLETALNLASHTVYSLHKTSTREHIKRKAKQWGVNAQVLAELKWDIPAMYKFHQKKSVDIFVDFWRFEKPKSKSIK